METPRECGTGAARGAVVVCVVVAVVAAASVAAVAGTASAQRAAGIDGCTTIDTSGRYTLAANVTATVDGADEGCIEITASDVVLDGMGHTLAGSGEGHGVEINGSAGTVSNVTVERLHARNWSIGVFSLEATDGTIADTVTTGNTEGVALGASIGYELNDNTAIDNAIAVAVGGESRDNTLRGTVAIENKWGIHFERESGDNRVLDSIARNNSRWSHYSERDERENAVRTLDLATATVSAVERNVALRSVRSPPPLPSGTASLGSFVEVSATRGGDHSLSLTMTHEATDRPVSLWRHDGQFWSRVPDAQVNASTNSVSVDNRTEFGVFAVLADAGNSSGGPVNVSTDPLPSVQRTLTPVPDASTTTPVPTGSTNTSADSPATAATATNQSTATERANATGERAAATSAFGVGPFRLLLVALGIAVLVALGVVALRERSGGRGGGI